MPKGGHVRLTGEECDEKDQAIAGKSYQVRYLGSSVIVSYEGKGKGCTDAAVREIYSRYSTKNTVKSLPKRELFVSANCVSLYAPVEDAVVFRFQTVYITFCNTNEENRNAFAFVVKESTNVFRAHVLHCDNPTQANDICVAMHQAFIVRSAWFQAKRVDRAGWANGLLSSQEKLVASAQQNGEQRTGKTNENRVHDEIDSNNNFGAFACAVVLPCPSDICNESKNNNNVDNPNLTRYQGRFSLATMLLEGGKNRGRNQRSHSLPFQIQNSWAASNGEWGCFQGSEEDDVDDFSSFARERSSSVGLLMAE